MALLPPKLSTVLNQTKSIQCLGLLLALTGKRIGELAQIEGKEITFNDDGNLIVSINKKKGKNKKAKVNSVIVLTNTSPMQKRLIELLLST